MVRFLRLRIAIVALGILTAFGSTTVAQTSTVSTSLQFLHLSPDPAVSPISVWAGVPVFGTTQFFSAASNISFRGATPSISSVASPFGQVSAAQFIGQPLSANLTPITNTSATPTIQGGQFGNLLLGTGANIAFVRGVVDPTAYAANPNGKSTRLTISVATDPAPPVAASTTRILLYQGVTDAPPLDVVIRETGDLLASQLTFDQVIAYVIPTGNYTIDVYQSSPKTLLASYNAPLQTLGYAGQRVTICASGFLTPSLNKNGAAFGLVAVPNTEIIATPTVLTTAAPPSAGTTLPAISLQTIHASADPTLSPIALWLNTVPFGGAQFFPISTNLAFRSATPVRTSISAGSLQVPIAGNTGRPTDALITAVTTGTLPGAGIINVPNYVLQPLANFTLLEGVRDSTRFAPNPSGRSIRFQLRTLPDTATFVASAQTRLLVAHSVTDAPDIVLDVRDALGNTLGTLGPLTYGLTFVTTNLGVGNYTLAMRPNGTSTVLGTFSLNLLTENLGGKRVLLTATGFANPAQNLGAPGVRILAVVNDSTGRSFLLPGGFTAVREEQGIGKANAGMLLHIISPNPVRDEATLRYELSETKEIALTVVDALGKTIWSTERRLMPQGTHTQILDASTFAQGAYMVRLSDARGSIVSTRLIVVR